MAPKILGTDVFQLPPPGSKKRFWYRCKEHGYQMTLPKMSEHLFKEHTEILIGTAKDIERLWKAERERKKIEEQAASNVENEPTANHWLQVDKDLIVKRRRPVRWSTTRSPDTSAAAGTWRSAMRTRTGRSPSGDGVAGTM